ncbi:MULTISPECIES: ABC transporter substrate-binding protein [Thermomonosporaceae]|uniref:ABC transporter substrate-binding protein n=1 Tax=Thermomonosporaceae TaxID=2012 RepID=UPI00255AA98D|nr:MULTISPECIES: iron-siderophore ABC transporter substrate-binding protein [Thermomonosporaceae]MDL4771271.1 iron-siderophore ABC transporter substrate-binding protein [Actinomadura xylanilytica]
MRISPLRRTAVGVALTALTALGLGACGSSGDGDGGGAPLRTVQHAMGTTKIFKEPKRVVALDQAFVDAAVTLDADVYGYTSYRSIEEKLPDYLGEAGRAHGAQAQSVGTLTEPSLEKISALKPDLILSAKVRHEALYGKLAQIAPTVFSETTGGTWKDNIRLTAKALGREPLAEQRIKEYETRAGAIGAEIAKKNDGKLPTIAVARFTDEPTVRLYTENSYSGIVLKDVGFPRPEGQPTSKEIAVDLSEERIKDLDADRIFIATYTGGEGKSTQVQAKFKNNPLWGKLKGGTQEVPDVTWMSAVGLQGAHAMLDDVAKTFGVDPVRKAA